MKFTAALIFVIFTCASLLGQTSVSFISPAAGLTRGGEIVHIHGTNLLGNVLLCSDASCTNTVSFGGVPATIIDNTETEIVVLAPPHTAGSVTVAVTVSSSAPVSAAASYDYQDPAPSDQIRFLAPVVISSAGALNTSWVSELSIYNGSSESMAVSGPTLPGSRPLTLPAFSSAIVALHPPAGNSGAFLYVPRLLADNIVASLRVHETTRDSESWGTEVPVIPETQFRRSVVLTNVPTDSRFRTLLRVYSYAAGDATEILSIRDESTGELLDTSSLALQSGLTGAAVSPDAPAYAQIALESLAGPLGSTHPRVRAEISPVASSGPPIWAFAAITNNATQQVTTITPTAIPTPLSIPTSSTVALGHWGGDSSCMDVTGTDINIAFACGNGTFSRPIPGPDHRFEVDGTVQIIVGPSVPPPNSPAHFSGVLQGTGVTVTIRSGNSVLGPFTMQLGLPGNCGHPCP